jgi:hypothetical protein
MEGWNPISSAPADRDLRLAVIESGEVHALVFPCRRARGGWIHAETGKPILVSPTHWCEWFGKTL